MMDSFLFENNNKLAVNILAGNVMFCLNDLCSILEIDEYTTKEKLNMSGAKMMMLGNQYVTFIDEQNLFRILLTSQSPMAEKVSDWIIGKVMPEMRAQLKPKNNEVKKPFTPKQKPQEKPKNNILFSNFEKKKVCPEGKPPCSRVVYIVFALFLGTLGIHDIYIGNTKTGVIKMILTLGLSWTFIVPFCMGIFAIIEICTVTKDAYDRPLV